MAIDSTFVTQTGVGASKQIGMRDTTDFKVACGVTVSGTVTYTLQETFDEEVFFDNDDMKDETTSQSINYTFPVRAVRVNITAGTGTVKLFVRQLLA